MGAPSSNPGIQKIFLNTKHLNSSHYDHSFPTPNSDDWSRTNFGSTSCMQSRGCVEPIKTRDFCVSKVYQRLLSGGRVDSERYIPSRVQACHAYTHDDWLPIFQLSSFPMLICCSMSSMSSSYLAESSSLSRFFVFKYIIRSVKKL